MATNKILLKTTEQFMADYQPIYQPIYPLFLGKSAAYPDVVGKVNFNRLDTVGDIRAKHLLPKDTEMKQISVATGSKTYKKYFLANQYIQSNLQDSEGNEEIIAQVLDEHQKQFDDLLLLGEGTSASTMINNGLYWSADANYRLETSAEVAKGTAEDHLRDLHSKIMAASAVANGISGRKILIVYGSTASAKFSGLYSNTDAVFSTVLAGALGSNYNIVTLPTAVTPSAANGYMIVNADNVKLHYTVLPQLKDRGVNSEKMYSWHNFLMGSCMLEVLVDDAVIRQPLTFQA